MLKVQILSYTPDPDRLIAAAAKLCYSDSGIDDIIEELTPARTQSFLKKLVELGHESPLEHAGVTFGIQGVSRVLLAQITRHRIASFSVQSQRYVAMEGFEYIMPPEIAKNEEARGEFLKAMEICRAQYEKLSGILYTQHMKSLTESGMDEKTASLAAEKLACEDARFVLPNACDTKIVMTMNLRSLLHFFSLRCCSRAQWEIRELACEMLRLVKEISPEIFQYAGPACVSGTCSEGPMSCGKAKQMKAFFTELKNR